MSHALTRAILFALFALSGFSGLIYEAAWSHYLKLILGHAAYGQTLVLVIFMGGLAIGAALASHYLPRIRNPLRSFALIEAILGILGVAFHTLFLVGYGVIFDMVPAMGSDLSAEILKWTTASLLVLPQSVLMGMTFPLLSAGIMRLIPRDEGNTLSYLYFTNTLGGALGVLASGFVLVPNMGLPGATLTAGLGDLLVAILVWPLTKQAMTGGEVAITGKVESAPIRENVERAAGYGMLFWLSMTALITGLASFIYEIVWIRMLSLVLGSSTQSFELMLSAFIFGLALGSFWIRNRLDSMTHPIRYLGYIQVAMGCLAVLTIPLYHTLFDLMGWMLQALSRNDQGYLLFNVASQGIALLVMLPATFMAGMTLPLITLIAYRRYGEVSVGSVYAANTLGSILGILLAVHWLMPSLGLRLTLGLGAGLDALLGVVLLVVSSRSSAPAGSSSLPRRVLAAVGASAVLFAVVLGATQFDPARLNSGVYRQGRTTLLNTESLYQEDGKTATVSLIHEPDNSALIISTNGKPDAGLRSLEKSPSGDEPTMILLGAMPLALRPDAREVANIGFGSGLTVHTILGEEDIERVDTVEIEPKMVEAARLFGDLVGRSFEDPRSHIIIQDAKTFFSRNARSYDIIVSEPSNPWVSGVASLFTDEFYEDISRYLNEDGLLVQWFHTYESSTELISAMGRALNKHFPRYALYSISDLDIMFIATRGDRSLTEFDPQIFEDPELRASLARAGIDDVADLQARLIGESEYIQPFLETLRAPVNSDFFPYIANQAPRFFFLKRRADEITNLLYADVPVLDLLGARTIPDTPLGEGHGFWQYEQLQATAYVILDTIADNSEALNEEINDDAMAMAVRVLRHELMQCPTGQDTANETLLSDILLNVARVAAPFLPRADADALWRAIMDYPCYPRLPERLQRETELYHAVARHDFPTMQRIALALLDAREIENITLGTDYLFTSALTSLLAQGQAEEARLLWERFAPLFNKDAPATPSMPYKPHIMFLLAQLQRTLSAPPSQGVQELASNEERAAR